MKKNREEEIRDVGKKSTRWYRGKKSTKENLRNMKMRSSDMCIVKTSGGEIREQERSNIQKYDVEKFLRHES